MRRTTNLRSSSGLALTAGLAALLLTAACGNSQDATKNAGSSRAAGSTTPSPTADTSLGKGSWLIAMTTAGGADGESAITTYLTYDPSTGQASARKLPGFRAPSAVSGDAALLVSADRKWAILDTGIPKAQEDSGRLELYSLADGRKTVLDIRRRTGDPTLRALGWAFDPTRPGVLRVVDSKSRVWTLGATGGAARRTGTLRTGQAWIFANGFNHNTGAPYVENIDSYRTDPPGNGELDRSAVERDGGTVLASDSAALAKLPKSPCRLAGGFVDAQGTTWEFCGDADSVKAYLLPKDSQDWQEFGRPSTAVAPVASAVTLVLPPAAS